MSRSESNETHTTLGEGASQASVTMEGNRIRDWVIGIVMGITIVSNIVLWLAYRDAGTEQRLHEYEVAQLRVQADLNAELQKIILSRSTCHE